MGWHLNVGPPGSGRTTAMVAAARAACDAGRRVWWVGLPAQRGYVLRRVTEGGYTALGLEVMSGQQMYYRLLTAANRLKPMLIGSARLVRVVEALADVVGALPTPGEAHLFARAIAEAKRFGLTPQAYEAQARDAEQHRFAAVYRAYQQRLDGYWDYDDVRTAAVDLAEEGELHWQADVVIVDGVREIGPLELRLYRALAEHADVHLNLAAPPPGEAPTTTFDAPHPVTVERYLAPNPVSEARWVMRSLKRDLFEGGYQPLELALVAPPDRARALATLAEEYGVPLMDESPLALVDRPLGQRLVDLLELVEHPTAARILALPGMRPLASAALDSGVAGNEATDLLADRLGLGAEWRAWLRRLEVSGEPVAWARALIQEVLGADGVAGQDFVEGALAKAQEAARLGDGPGFRAWWAALLRDTRTARREPAGVALTSATVVSGRRFRKAYVLGAVEGAYAAREQEDYFLPEEQRLPLEEAFARLGLPRRFQGRGAQLADELLTRGDAVVVTAPRAGQGGPLVSDEALLGGSPAPLPELAAGSRLELAGAEGYRAPLVPVRFGQPTVERLRRYRQCSFRVWGESLLRRGEEWQDDLPQWRRLLQDLLGERNSQLDDARLAELADAYPEARGWLERHRERLYGLTFNVGFGGGEGRATALLHAAERGPLGAGERQQATLYRFVEPGLVTTPEEARGVLYDRWSEYWSAGILFDHPRQPMARVDIVVWPLLGEPVSAFERGVSRNFGLLRRRREAVREELARWQAGEAEPRPGYHCRDCPVFDLCREGTRQ